MKKVTLSFICILFVLGCANKDIGESNDQSKSTIINSQENMNNDKDLIKDKVESYFQKENEKVASYKAIHTKNQLFVAFNARSFQQPNEQDLEKTIKKTLKKRTNIKNIYVTSDQKFYMELSKLEDQSLTDSELNQKIKTLKKLMKESL